MTDGLPRSEQEPAPPPEPADTNEELPKVGYCKPPKQHQFKKGESGNPRGRPRGSINHKTTVLRSFEEEILAESRRLVAVGEGDTLMYLTVQETLARLIVDGALKGDKFYVKLTQQVVTAAQKKEADEKRGLMEAALAYKDKWEFEYERLIRQGLPVPLPHPDDILIDPVSGDVQIVGPTTKEQKAAMDELVRLLDAHIARFEDPKSLWYASPEMRRQLRRRQLKVIQKWNNKLPPRLRRTFDESIDRPTDEDWAEGWAEDDDPATDGHPARDDPSR